MEFPAEEQNYPGIWVDYTPIGPLQVAGVGHVEYAEASSAGFSRRFTRWRFQGEASFTLVALTSLQRDRLYDELVRVMAFGTEQGPTSEFRTYIEDNEFLAVNFDFDEVGSRGFANSLGTPWQTDDMVYEAEVAMECFGEFVGDAKTRTLVPLSQVIITPYSDREEDPTEGGGWE